MVSLFYSNIVYLLLSNELNKHPYNWFIRFTVVIIINDECVSKYAHAAITIFKWDTENIYNSFTGM